MKIPFLLICLLLACVNVTQAADPVATPDAGASLVTAATIEARLKEVDASTELDETTKGTLTSLLTKALGNLEAVRSNDAATEKYMQALQQAPEETERIRTKLEKAKADDTEASIKSTEDSPFDEIEQELLQEKANLAAVKEKLADLEDQISKQVDRLNVVRKRLVEVKSQRTELDAALNISPPANELPWLTEARRWSQQTQIAALRSEGRMLDQELLSQPVRVKLLEARRDEQMRSVSRISSRVKRLEALANRKGKEVAEQAEAEAMATVYDAAGKHSLIQALAAENAALTQTLKTMTVDLREATAGDDDVLKEAKSIESNFRVAREKLQIAGMSDVLGEVLRKQRARLPDLRKLKKLSTAYERENARIALQQIQHDEEFKRLRDVEEYVDALVEGLPPEEVSAIRADLVAIAKIRRTLLDKVLSLENSYIRALNELDDAYRRQYEIARAFDAFLAEKLLWIRSAPWPGLNDLRLVPGQVGALLSPHEWVGVSEVLLKRAIYSAPFMLMLALFAYLLWKMRRFRALIRVFGQQVGKPSRDRFVYTLKALGLTLLLAAPWPLLLYALGWALGNSPEVTDFSLAVSTALLWVAPALFYVQFFSVLCMPGGVAERHFLWPVKVLQQLRREFSFLKVTFLPAAFATTLAVYTQGGAGGALGVGFERLALVTTLVLLAVFFYRVSSVALKHLSDSAPRIRQLYVVLTVLVPLVLAGLAFIGYFYTAGTLATSLIATLWFVFGLVLLHQVAVRWLLLAQRRIFLQAVRKRMEAARQEGKPEVADIDGISLEVEEPEIDLMALREESRKLLNTVLVIIGIIGFWIIWSDLLPAFGILNQVTLWHHNVVADGVEGIAPITLADLGKGVLIAIAAFIAMKRLPALLEIVLLQRFKMTSGSRYTVTTLTTYCIVAVGALLFFRTIGADWSKLQWLFAALGVGIGFGLQEIVANFISGLIILFERPIRVGDVVTVGDTDGVVTRIRIRATTIKNWENQELLVPNKEFITGRLLNWSLSDQTTRIKVAVGVAYGSDVQKAMQLLDQAARENPSVLADPPPSVIFTEFGDNALNLTLRCFVGSQNDRMPTITALHEAINHKFNDAGICISFPQRDVHLDTSRPLDIRIQRGGSDQGAAG
ncbi:MAG: mechanosensitive ion channel [Gammaproteobacteria bacterium]